jgi:hypothetical protein
MDTTMTARNSDTPSSSENHCRPLFDRFLKGRQPEAEITWAYVPEPEQPPDYYLAIDGRRFAVEVTGLMPTVEVDGNFLQEVAVETSLWRLVAEIKQSALAEGLLEGQYEVYFVRPVQDLKKLRSQIRLRITEYLRRTKLEASYPDEVVIPDTCVIRKLARKWRLGK